MRGVPAVLALAALLAVPARADESGLARAHEVLRKMRAVRAERAARVSADVPLGHHIRKPPPLPPPPPPPEERVVYPELKPTGTIRVGAEVRVVTDKGTFAVGDEVEPGWKVVSITAKQLTVQNGALSKSYRIP